MHSSGLKWGLLVLFFDRRVHQLAKVIATRRVRDARLREPYDPCGPPWCIPLGDRRYAYQLQEGMPWTKLALRLGSPEWMLAVVLWTMARANHRLYPALEYRLTADPAGGMGAPESDSPLPYLWWRLNKYFGISPEKSYLFTDDLLLYAIEVHAPVLGP